MLRLNRIGWTSLGLLFLLGVSAWLLGGEAREGVGRVDGGLVASLHQGSAGVEALALPLMGASGDARESTSEGVLVAEGRQLLVIDGASGHGLADCRVILRPGSGSDRGLPTSADGTLELPAFAEIDGSIELSKLGYETVIVLRESLEIQLAMAGKAVVLLSPVGSLTIHVMAEGGGNVPGARISVVPLPGKCSSVDGEQLTGLASFTDGQGRVTLERVPLSRGVEVVVSCSGYVSQKLVRSRLGTDGAPDVMAVTLVPSGALRGRVVDGAGRGVSGVRVVVEGGEARASSQLFHAMSDEDGEYVVPGVAPGPASIKLYSRPSVRQVVQVHPAREARAVDFVLRGQVVLDGRVLQGCESLARYVVRGTSSRGEELAVATGQHGEFQLMVEPGWLELQVYPHDRVLLGSSQEAVGTWRGEVPLEAGAVEIDVSRGLGALSFAVPVASSFDAGSTSARCWSFPRREPAEEHITLGPWCDNPRSVVLGDLGEGLVGCLPPGDQGVLVEVGTRRSWTSRVEFVPGAAAELGVLDFTNGRLAGSLKGDGRRLRWIAELNAVVESARHGGRYSTLVAEDGSFSFESVMPGPYFLLLNSGPGTPSIRRNVEISGGAECLVEVETPGSGAIRGMILGSWGEVRLTQLEVGGDVEVFVDSEGTMFMDGLVPGPYRIDVDGRYGALLAVRSGETATFSLDLTGREVDVRVVGQQGTELQFVRAGLLPLESGSVEDAPAAGLATILADGHLRLRFFGAPSLLMGVLPDGSPRFVLISDADSVASGDRLVASGGIVRITVADAHLVSSLEADLLSVAGKDVSSVLGPAIPLKTLNAGAGVYEMTHLPVPCTLRLRMHSRNGTVREKVVPCLSESSEVAF